MKGIEYLPVFKYIQNEKIFFPGKEGTEPYQYPELLKNIKKELPSPEYFNDIPEMKLNNIKNHIINSQTHINQNFKYFR